MKQKIGAVALVLRDYNEAIAYYTQKFGFQLLEDTDARENRIRLLRKRISSKPRTWAGVKDES